MYQNKNLPESLLTVVEKWSNSCKDFYLGPENIFLYQGRKIKYLSNPDIPEEKGTWFAASGNFDSGIIPELTREQIEEIALCLAKYFRPYRWSITLDYHCNFTCSMCPFHGGGYESDFNEDYWKRRMSQKRVFPKDEAFDIIDVIAGNGITQLNLGTVGELFLYPYWREVANYAHKKEMELGTITNGSMINDELCKSMKEVGIVNVRVSLDALTYETYSKVRSSIRKNFETAVNAPLLLKKHGFTVNVHFVKVQENIHEAKDFLEYWKGTDVDSISMANQLVYHERVTTDKPLSMDANPQYESASGRDEFIHGICSKYGNFITQLNGNVVGCCEMTALYLDDDPGGLPVLNFKNDSFDQCIESLKGLIMDKKSPLLSVCWKCPLYTLFTEEETVPGWRVYRTKERETWVRLGTSK